MTMRIATADLYDEHAGELEVCETQLRRYGAVAAFHGEIVTYSFYAVVKLTGLVASDSQTWV